MQGNSESAVEPMARLEPVQWKDLRQWLAMARRYDEVLDIDREVDVNEELSALTYLAAQSKPSKAMLFNALGDNPHKMRILTNMLGASKERYALAVGLDPRMSISGMIAATRQIVKRRLPPIHIPEEDAPVNEVVLVDEDVDLTSFPAPRFWPLDGGPFIGTGNITLTADPASGRINVGVYRQQLYGPNRVGLSFVPGRHGESDCKAQWALGRPAEVVVAYGIDPALFIVGSQRFGTNESELDVAGGIMGFPVELTSARRVSLPIPAHAEMVIEGFVHEGDEEIEGPLGEFHGFYSGAPGRKPVIEVKAIHYRRAPIMTAALMANYPAGEIGAYNSIMRSARILDNLDAIGVAGIKGAYCHPAAAAGNALVVVSIKQMYPGHSGQVLALAAQCPAANYYTKWIIVVDDDIDPTNIDDVLWALSVRCNPSDHIDVLRNTMSFRADPSIAPDQKPYGSKALIDACTPYKHMATAPKRCFLRKPVYDKICGNWHDYGLSGEPPQITTFEV